MWVRGGGRAGTAGIQVPGKISALGLEGQTGESHKKKVKEKCDRAGGKSSIRKLPEVGGADIGLRTKRRPE